MLFCFLNYVKLKKIIIMAQLNIKGLNKAEVFKALYDKAEVQGMGFLHAVAGDMSIKEAEETVKNQTYFDYHHGRVMKVDISGDTLETWLYDRDNGNGAAERALSHLMK